MLVSRETISPELVLVDPELGSRARASLPDRPPADRRLAGTVPATPDERVAPAEAQPSRPYPLWARVTAALWLLVIGILIGGAAIPHAEDKPRLIPNVDNPPPTVCKAPQATPQVAPHTRYGFP